MLVCGFAADSTYSSPPIASSPVLEVQEVIQSEGQSNSELVGMSNLTKACICHIYM